jgi:hypothetical protein
LSKETEPINRVIGCEKRRPKKSEEKECKCKICPCPSRQNNFKGTLEK